MNLKKFHQEILVWDAHRDLHYEMPLKDRFLQRHLCDVDLHLPLLMKGGIQVQTYAYCYAATPGAPSTIQAIADIEKVFEEMEKHSAEIVLVKSVEEALQARQAGRLAAFFSFEGGEPIANDLWILRFFHRLGFRAMGLTWNFRNDLADGGYEGREGYGLSQFGRQVVEEMNKLGMVVDLAHLTPQSMIDVMKISTQPVIHSHGGIRGVNPNHPRMLDDAMLERIAENGGVFCVTTVPNALVTGRPATLADYLDQIDYAVKTMGDEHVGLGADFDVYQSHLEHPLGSWTVGLEEADRWMNVTQGLLERGHSPQTVARIMGENLMRVYRTVIGK